MKKIIGLCLLGFALANCSNSDDNDNNVQLPIRLNSNVVVTRYLQETQIVRDQQLSLFVTPNAVTTAPLYNNVPIIADGNGGFSSTPLYYPLGAVNVDFYAINPYSSTLTLNTPYRFSVEEDQSDNADYLNSDLLYARSLDVARSSEAVRLEFEHKLTKVTFVVKQSGLISLENLTDIEVLNVLTDITLNPVTGDLSAAEGATTASVTVNNVQGTTETSQTNMAAIIVPQTFTAAVDKPFIKITVDGNDFFYTPSTDIVFASGNSYNYTITLFNTGITVTSEILPWDEQPDTEGEGTPGN